MTILILPSEIPGTQLCVACNQLWSESKYIMFRKIRAVTGSRHVDSCCHASDRTKTNTKEKNWKDNKQPVDEERALSNGANWVQRELYLMGPTECVSDFKRQTDCTWKILLDLLRVTKIIPCVGYDACCCRWEYTQSEKYFPSFLWSLTFHLSFMPR